MKYNGRRYCLYYNSSKLQLLEKETTNQDRVDGCDISKETFELLIKQLKATYELYPDNKYLFGTRNQKI